MPPLRGALMRFRLRSDFTSDQLALPLFPAVLRRVDPARNMRRFYSLDVERDLFGNVVLVPRWGRIGTAGRVRLDEYPGEGRAVAAMKGHKPERVRHSPVKSAGFRSIMV